MSGYKYKRSLNLYIIEAAVEYFISIMISGSFLAKVTESLNISDFMTGIISSFVSLGCVFQLLSIFFFRKSRVKRRVIFFEVLNQTVFTAIYIVPLLDISYAAKQIIFVACMLMGYIVFNIVNSAKINWYMSLVDNKKRGVFTANKEIVSLLGGMIFSFAMGCVMDYFEDAGNVCAAFFVCAVSVFILMIIHTLTLIFSQEKEETNIDKEDENESVFDALKLLLKNEKVRKVIAVCFVWYIAVHAATPFYGTYQIKELGFSMKFVSAIGIMYSLVRAVVSRMWGVYADKHGFLKMVRICFGIAAVGFFINIFTVPSNGKVLFTIYYACYAVAMAGVNSALLNLIYDCVETKFQRNALVLKQAVSGILGFAATVVSGLLVSYIQSNGNRFFGINVYAQQVVSMIAFAIITWLVFYIKQAFKNYK